MSRLACSSIASLTCKPVPNTSLFVNVDILYLLSHVNFVSLLMGQINSEYYFAKRIGTLYRVSFSKYQSSKLRHGVDNETASYIPLLRWWPLCKDLPNKHLKHEHISLMLRIFQPRKYHTVCPNESTYGWTKPM